MQCVSLSLLVAMWIPFEMPYYTEYYVGLDFLSFFFITMQDCTSYTLCEM